MPPTAKQEAPDLSAVFAGLEITPSDEPLPEATRGGVAGPNPFKDPLLASITHGKPYSVYLPTNAVQRAVFLINAAARKENKGVRIVVNTQKDDKGKPKKGKDGKVLYAAEASGPNAGKVLVRFQGKNERKAQTAPRTHSIVRDKDDPAVYFVRRRSDKTNVFRGTHDEARAEYKRIKDAEAKAVVPAAPAQTPTPTGEAAPTPASTVEVQQGATPSDTEPKQEGAPAA